MMTLALTLLCASGIALASPSRAENGSASDFSNSYSTRAERRDAGRKHHVTEWLTLTGLLELEYAAQREDYIAEPSPIYVHSFAKNVQVAMEVEIGRRIHGEVIYEYEVTPKRHRLDEAFLIMQISGIEVDVGMFYVPFGIYFNHLINEPLPAFGETRGRGIMLASSSNARFELSAFLFRPSSEASAAQSARWNMGAAVEIAPATATTLGISYLRDLNDSEEGVLRGDDGFAQNSVSGMSAYTAFALQHFELTFEFVRTLDEIQFREPAYDRPSAWNGELALEASHTMEIAFRIAGSAELEDAPHVQSAMAITTRPVSFAIVTFEFLRDFYTRALDQDPDSNSATRVDQFSLQASFAF